METDGVVTLLILNPDDGGGSPFRRKFELDGDLTIGKGNFFSLRWSVSRGFSGPWLSVEKGLLWRCVSTVGLSHFYHGSIGQSVRQDGQKRVTILTRVRTRHHFLLQFSSLRMVGFTSGWYTGCLTGPGPVSRPPIIFLIWCVCVSKKKE